ncbi:MAG: FCSD flavin-binding domain-containing protein, partial [Kiloniellales bacterium]
SATCFFSNLYLAGLRSLESLVQGYGALAAKHGVTVVHDRAAAIDPDRRSVRLASGDRLAYDRLVLAPGIELRYDAIAGYDQAASALMPHAWDGGPQVTTLKQQLEAMEDGGLFVLAAPPNPFRCPPGPYERVSMVAHYLKTHKPRAKVIVLDAKNSFSKQPLFLDAWDRHYQGMVEWLPVDFTGGIESVDAKSHSITTAAETFTASVANIIPPQMAGRIARDAGLADESGWCPVDPTTLESKQLPGIHLVGDAIIPGDMPKSGFAANSQAKVCAQAIVAALTDRPAFEARFFNTCWSFLAEHDAVSIGASYQVVDGKITAAESFLSDLGESAEERAKAARQAESWYRAFTADIFG